MYLVVRCSRCGRLFIVRGRLKRASCRHCGAAVNVEKTHFVQFDRIGDAQEYLRRSTLRGNGRRAL